MAWGSLYCPDFLAISTTGAAAGTTALNDRRLVELLNNSAGMTFVADAIDKGRYAIRMDQSTAATNFSLSLLASSSRYAGIMTRFRVNALGGSPVIAFIRCTTTNDNFTVRTNQSGVLQYSTNNAANWTAVPGAGTVRVGDVHRIELFADWGTGTTHTFKIIYDGAELLNTTGGTTAATSLDPQVGSTVVSVATTVDYSDCACYNDVAQYGTVNAWRVLSFTPTADGAHSMASGGFQDETSANLSNATTTAWQKVDDAPSGTPGISDFVQQVISNTASYMEFTTSAYPAGYLDPKMVCLAAAMHPVGGTTANLAAFRLNSNGNVSSEAAIDTSISNTANEFRKHHYQAEPSTAAAWTAAMLQGTNLRFRFGYSTDVSPPPALDWIQAWALAPVRKTAISVAAA